MKYFSTFLALLATGLLAGAASPDTSHLIEPIRSYVTNTIQSFDDISTWRRKMLKETADFLVDDLKAGKPANLVFTIINDSANKFVPAIHV